MTKAYRYLLTGIFSMLLAGTAGAIDKDDPHHDPDAYSLADLATGQTPVGRVQLVVKVKKVTGVDAAGKQHVLLKEDRGLGIRLCLLSDIRNSLNASLIPHGTYNNLKVELADEVTLTNRKGVAFSDKLSAVKAPLEVGMFGTVLVTDKAVEAPAIEFDMRAFQRPLPPKLHNAFQSMIEANHPNP